MLGIMIGNRSTAPDASILLKHIDNAAALGCIVDRPEVAAARTAADQARDLNARAHDFTRTETQQQEIDALADRVYRQQITDTQMMNTAMRIDAAGNVKGAAYTAMRRAASKANAEAVRHLTSIGDAWITDIIGPRINTLVNELRRLAEQIPTDVTCTTMPAQGRDVRDLWTRASDIADDIANLHAVADHLRSERCVPATAGNASVRYWFRHLDRLPHHVKLESDRVLFWLTAIRQRCEPTCLTERGLQSVAE